MESRFEIKFLNMTRFPALEAGALRLQYTGRN